MKSVYCILAQPKFLNFLVCRTLQLMRYPTKKNAERSLTIYEFQVGQLLEFLNFQDRNSFISSNHGALGPIICWNSKGSCWEKLTSFGHVEFPADESFQMLGGLVCCPSFLYRTTTTY